MTPPTAPRPPIRKRRKVQPRASRSSTRIANSCASAKAGASANRRSNSRSNMNSAMDLTFDIAEVAARREPLSELIQTTFDMGFDRSQGRIQGSGGFAVRHPAAIAERDADPFGRGQALEGFVEVDAAGRPRLRRPGFNIVVRRFDRQRLPSFATPTFDVEPRGDPFDPGLEGALAAKV